MCSVLQQTHKRGLLKRMTLAGMELQPAGVKLGRFTAVGRQTECCKHNTIKADGSLTLDKAGKIFLS